jgi:hypothetical protein
MKKSLLLVALLLVAMSAFADTTINNFTGYNDYWHPYGDNSSSTQTYGEVFTLPNATDTNLSSFSFYIGNPIDSGNIITGAYIATWTGSQAGTLLYSSSQYDYDNTGNVQLTFNTGGLALQTGQQYVMFLSTSNYHGQSAGSTYISTGNTDPNLLGFVYYNNAGDFNALFNSGWDGTGLQPDWAVNLEFNQVPEPSSLLMLGTGILGGIGVLRRKLF